MLEVRATWSRGSQAQEGADFLVGGRENCSRIRATWFVAFRAKDQLETSWKIPPRQQYLKGDFKKDSRGSSVWRATRRRPPGATMLRFSHQSSLHLTEKRAGNRSGLNVDWEQHNGHERTCHKTEGKAESRFKWLMLWYHLKEHNGDKVEHKWTEVLTQESSS